MKLQQLLSPDRIKLDIEAKDREGVIDQLVGVLAEAGVIDNIDEVRQMVIDREHQVGTGIGYGVAIPHAEPGPFSQPLAVLGRLVKGVDFQAPDKATVRLVFLLLTPDETPALHVRLLARICRLTRAKQLRQKLLEVETPEEAAEVIASAEADYPELTS